MTLFPMAYSATDMACISCWTDCILQIPHVPKAAVDQLLQLSHSLRQTNDPTVSSIVYCTWLAHFRKEIQVWCFGKGCCWNPLSDYGHHMDIQYFQWESLEMAVNYHYAVIASVFICSCVCLCVVCCFFLFTCSIFHYSFRPSLWPRHSPPDSCLGYADVSRSIQKRVLHMLSTRLACPGKSEQHR